MYLCKPVLNRFFKSFRFRCDILNDDKYKSSLFLSLPLSISFRIPSLIGFESLNSFVLLEHLAMLQTSTVVINC